MEQHPMEYVRELQAGAIEKIQQGDLAAAEELLRQAIEATKQVPLAPGWGDYGPSHGVGEFTKDERAIVCLQFVDPVVFAADPYFEITSDALHKELRSYGIREGARIVLDLLCSNGSTCRFFEGVYSVGYGIRDVKPVPLEQWDELREQHAQPLAHYDAGGQLSTVLLTSAQKYAVRRGIAFPVRQR